MLIIAGAVAYYRYLIWQVNSDDPQVWQRTINSFLQADQKSSPQSYDAVFVGSSSFRFWRSLEADMAPLKVLNRGFGGAKSNDINYYFDALILPHKTRAIVYYAGDNDLSMGQPKSVAQVLQNFMRFVATAQKLPTKPHIYFVSIKPSPARMAQWQTMQAANQLIKNYSRSHHNITYIDITSVMLAPARKKQQINAANLDANIFLFDGVHLNKKGYQRWTAVIKPTLLQRLRKDKSN